VDEQVLAWAGDKEVRLGVPAYDDRGSGYHDPDVENPGEALMGIHAALADPSVERTTYRGVAVYSDWEMSDEEWTLFGERFGVADSR